MIIDSRDMLTQEHFNKCGTRLQEKLDEYKRCRYVWDHWYGATVGFTSIE